MKHIPVSPFASGPAYPFLSPAIHARIQSEIDAACGEMESMHIKKPGRQLIGQMADRIYGNVKKAYPGVDRFVRDYERAMPPETQAALKALGVEAQWGAGGLFAALIAFWLLAGFCGRNGCGRRRY